MKLVNITKRYGNIVANDNINLKIQTGEYVSIIGPSGCGKTTLIKCIMGIISPDEGEIFINNKLVNNLPIEDRGIGYVFQNIALFPHMNVWENITFGSKVKRFPPEETRLLGLEMLDMIKVTARSDSYPSELSGGTQQKTAVARALMSRANLLLLDEPLGALDVKVRSKLRYELRKLVKDLNLTALHVTHDQEEAMSISDRVVVMKSGSIVEVGHPIDLYTNPKNIFTANFVGEANFLTGYFSEVSEKGSLIEIGENMKIKTRNKEKKVSDKVVIAFRPELAKIGTKMETNSLKGNLESVLYSGNIVRYNVRLNNDELVVVKRSLTSKGPDYDEGDKVMVTIKPKSVLLYEYPEKDLKSELSLE